MSNHVDVPASGATPAQEWTRSTSGASIRRVMVTSVATVLVAAAVTATSVYLIADEAPTTGVFGGPVYRAAQAAEQQLVNGIDPTTDLADILRFGAAAASANEAAEQQLVDGIDPATDLADILRFGAGVGAVSAAETAYLAQMVYAIDPATSVPDALGLGDRPCPATTPHPSRSWSRGIDPATDVRDILERGGYLPATGGRCRYLRLLELAQRALTSSKPGGRRGCGSGRTLGASCRTARDPGCS